MWLSSNNRDMHLVFATLMMILFTTARTVVHQPLPASSHGTVKLRILR